MVLEEVMRRALAGLGIDKNPAIQSRYAFLAIFLGFILFMIGLHNNFFERGKLPGVLITNIPAFLFTCPILFEMNLKKIRNFLGPKKYAEYVDFVLPVTLVFMTCLAWLPIFIAFSDGHR